MKMKIKMKMKMKKSSGEEKSECVLVCILVFIVFHVKDRQRLCGFSVCWSRHDIRLFPGLVFVICVFFFDSNSLSKKIVLTILIIKL